MFLYAREIATTVAKEVEVKKTRLLMIAALVILIMAAPMTVFADDNDYDYGYDYSPYHIYTYASGYYDEEWDDDWWRPAPRVNLDEMFRTRDNQTPIYVRLRAFAENEGAWDVRWDAENRIARIVTWTGDFIVVEVEAKGGFIEDGVAWVPLSVAADIQEALMNAWWGAMDPVDRIDLTIWEAYRFADVRDEPMFSTDLPHGEISLGYIEYMNDYLYARSPFTYRELEAAIWLVEELLAMGHDWDYIMAQEFTYWDIRDLEWSASGFGFLSWWMVTSEMLLGTGREDQIRLDRVSQNIILTIPGQSDSKIIVGAHYDSPPYPSASDNASGTALLLESAQRMLELDNYHTIVYIFFGAEEVGLIGAHYYYQMLTEAQRENILFMVNADVLIEGPYVIFGTGVFPTFDDADVAELIENILEASRRDLEEWLDTPCISCGKTGYEKINDPDDWWWTGERMTRDQIIEMMIEDNREWLEDWMPVDQLILWGIRMGLVEVYECEVAQKINSIAAELNRTHDFELLSLPEFAMAPSDHLIFLHEGHTVVNFAGMERAENVEERLREHRGEYWLRLESLGDGFSTTVLHSPLDDFHIIEAIWPGMMRNNMEAFSIFLERILTARFY